MTKQEPDELVEPRTTIPRSDAQTSAIQELQACKDRWVRQMPWLGRLRGRLAATRAVPNDALAIVRRSSRERRAAFSASAGQAKQPRAKLAGAEVDPFDALASKGACEFPKPGWWSRKDCCRGRDLRGDIRPDQRQGIASPGNGRHVNVRGPTCDLDGRATGPKVLPTSDCRASSKKPYGRL